MGINSDGGGFNFPSSKELGKLKLGRLGRLSAGDQGGWELLYKAYNSFKFINSSTHQLSNS